MPSTKFQYGVVLAIFIYLCIYLCTSENLSHSAGKHYLLCMHLLGLMTQATTLEQLDEVVVSAAVVLSSPSSGDNVEKHFHNLQTLLTSSAELVMKDSNITDEDFDVSYPLVHLKLWIIYSRSLALCVFVFISERFLVLIFFFHRR